MKTHKQRVLKRIPVAYCVRLNDRTGYLVWPGKVRARGVAYFAIGFGTTARAAWQDAEKNSRPARAEKA